MDEIAMFERIGKLAEENERLIGEIERLRGALAETAKHVFLGARSSDIRRAVTPLLEPLSQSRRRGE
jgi:hypothetical protein